MATRTTITLICDLCGREAGKGGGEVSTHVVEVDGQGVEAEVCARCWKPLEEKLAKLREGGRVSGKPKRRSGGKLQAV
jgi:hypothetical protein